MKFTRTMLALPFLGALITLLSGGCAAALPPIKTVDYVNLERFMGDWYVIATIPTFLEKGAYNAVESYALEDDGTIATTFTFNKGSFSGPEKRYTPRGFVRNTETNAEWGMQFIWPVKADYRITWLNKDYSQTVISRNQRDYVWIMARSPRISKADYLRMVDHIESSGYDSSKLVRVPQEG